MDEIISQLWTPELQMALTVFIVFLVVLYVLSIVWVVRDAYLRGTFWYIWAIVALVPLLGVIAYCLLRPPLLQIDRDEQELEVALKQRQLMQYGECANCGYPVEADYVLCPNCHQRLKNQCATPSIRRGRCARTAQRPLAAQPLVALELPAGRSSSLLVRLPWRHVRMRPARHRALVAPNRSRLARIRRPSLGAACLLFGGMPGERLVGRGFPRQGERCRTPLYGTVRI